MGIGHQNIESGTARIIASGGADEPLPIMIRSYCMVSSGNCLVSRVINSLCLYKPENNSGTRRCLLSLMLSHSQAALMSAILVFRVFARFNLRNACFRD